MLIYQKGENTETIWTTCNNFIHFLKYTFSNNFCQTLLVMPAKTFRYRIYLIFILTIWIFVKAVNSKFWIIDNLFLIPRIPFNLCIPVNNIHTCIALLVINGMILKFIQTHVATECYSTQTISHGIYHVPQMVLHKLVMHLS